MVQDDVAGAILVLDLNKEDGDLNGTQLVVVQYEENALLYEDPADQGGCVVIMCLALYEGVIYVYVLTQENHSLEFSH